MESVIDGRALQLCMDGREGGGGGGYEAPPPFKHLCDNRARLSMLAAACGDDKGVTIRNVLRALQCVRRLLR